MQNLSAFEGSLRDCYFNTKNAKIITTEQVCKLLCSVLGKGGSQVQVTCIFMSKIQGIIYNICKSDD